MRQQEKRAYVLSDETVKWAVRRYDNGNGPSIRQLAEACGVGYTTMHRALTRAGATMRRRGERADTPEGVA